MSGGTVVARTISGVTHGSMMGLTYCGYGVGQKWITFEHFEHYDCQKCKRADARADAGKPWRGKWGDKKRGQAGNQ